MKNILLFMSVCALFFQSGCNSKHHNEQHEKTKFLITSPLRMDTIITKSYVAQIHSIQHIELRALERGYLKQIFVDEGQFVKQGQLLFQIMPNMYQAEFEKANAEVSFAEIEYQNTKSLADSNIVSANELAMANAKLAKAKAELSIAKVHLDFTEIRAPFDGIIDRFHVRLGSLLDEGELLSSLSQNDQMWVYFNVPEAEYLDYNYTISKEKPQAVTLLLANNKMFNYPGKIETIEAEFNNETGNIAFRATFPNPKRLLRHGETGNIVMTIPLKNALLIPQKATFEILDKKYVFVIDENNVVKSREIKIAAELQHLFVIENGLGENEKILLEGLRLVNESDVIQTEFLEPSKALSNLGLYAE
ncbi:MAG: membrane fusion protein (multidrug efflux system) [Sphingobacteriales bacterium]|jgi:membrane fusion protein (multidrug efflux system)